jgi:hypothetical protein
VVGVLAMRIGARRRDGRKIGTLTRVQGVWRHRTRSGRMDEVVSKIVPASQPHNFRRVFNHFRRSRLRYARQRGCSSASRHSG